MEQVYIEEFKKVADSLGAEFNFEFGGDQQYGDCHISLGNRNLYVSFVSYESKFIAYSMNADIAPSELYMDIKIDNLENRLKRQNDILLNIKRLLGNDLKFVKKPSFFNKSRGYIEIQVDGKLIKVMQKKNIWNLPEV